MIISFIFVTGMRIKAAVGIEELSMNKHEKYLQDHEPEVLKRLAEKIHPDLLMERSALPSNGVDAIDPDTGMYVFTNWNPLTDLAQQMGLLTAIYEDLFATTLTFDAYTNSSFKMTKAMKSPRHTVLAAMEIWGICDE